MAPNRRTLLKATGALGATALAPSAAAEGAAASQTLDSGFDLESDDAQEALVVFESRESLDRMERLDADHYAFEVLPVVYARLTADQLLRVASWPGVRSVTPNRELEYYNAEAREVTGVDAVREGLEYTGDGVHAVVIDSGVDGTHPDLEDSLEHNYRYVDPIDEGTPWVDAGSANTDDNGHGTHVSGSICGSGAQSADREGGDLSGMAPDAELTVYSAGATLVIVQPVAAFDHMLANHADADLVSNSYGTHGGGDFDPDEPLNVASREAYEAGILPLFSAGNGGEECLTPAGQLGCERTYNNLNEYVKAPWVLGVAATDYEENVTYFSSRGRREEDDPGIEGAHYDRDAALENFEADEAEEAAVETYDTFSDAFVTAGAALVGYGMPSLEFDVTEPDPEDLENVDEIHAYRVDATLTWEPSNPEGTEPNDVELVLEGPQGIELASSEGGGLHVSESNEREIRVDVPLGSGYLFRATGWRGISAWEIEAEIQAVEYETEPPGPIGIYRPGVAAPGSDILSTLNPAHPLQATGGDTETWYGELSGTSMSCPVTAGISALVMEAHEDVHGEKPDPLEVIGFLEASAERDDEVDDPPHEPYNVGAGFVDAAGAVELATETDDEDEEDERTRGGPPEETPGEGEPPQDPPEDRPGHLAGP